MATTTTNTYQDLRAKLLANPEPIIDALIIGLTEAGVQYEWDSGTIEYLLEPIQAALGHIYGVPGVGNTGADNEALNYWRSVARPLGIGFDDSEEDEYTPGQARLLQLLMDGVSREEAHAIVEREFPDDVEAHDSWPPVA